MSELLEACEKIIVKIQNGEAHAYHLERFINTLNEGETPAMSLVLAMDASEHFGDSFQGKENPDAWAELPDIAGTTR